MTVSAETEPRITYTDKDCQAVEAVYINMGAILFPITNVIDTIERGETLSADNLLQYREAVERLKGEKAQSLKGFNSLDNHRNSCLGPKRKAFDELCPLIISSLGYIDTLLLALGKFINAEEKIDAREINYLKWQIEELKENISTPIELNPAYQAFVGYMRRKVKKESS